MDQRSEFSEALSALVEFATVNGNKITKNDVHDFFKDILTDESMYDSVYKYLSDIKITVSGYVPAVTKSEDEQPQDFKPNQAMETDEGRMFMDMYLSDLDAISVLDSEKLSALTTAAIGKDKAAINALVEAHLKMVIEIADEFKDSGIKMTDIISEGNIGLMEAVLKLNEVPDDITAHLKEQVRISISNAIEEEIGSLRTSNHLMERANKVSEATSYLAEKLGREATIGELSKYLSLPEEKIRDIIKMSLDAINIIEK